MSDAPSTPFWANPAPALDAWPTVDVADAGLGYRLPRPEHWSADPETLENVVERSHVYRGPMTGECLSITHMGNADPNADMRGWVGALLAMTGTPNLPMWAGHETAPTLTEWTPLGAPAELQTRLSLDELHCWEGFMTFSGPPAESVRVYLVMARRGRLAWKVFLSIASANLPGTEPDRIAAGDHARAAQIFGALTLGD